MFKIYDIVKLRTGHQIIITAHNPTRPKNCYTGVLAGGRGKQYIFGESFNPVKIGEASKDHPALRALEMIKEAKKPGSTEHQAYCQRMAAFGEHKDRWAILGRIKTGDPIMVKMRGEFRRGYLELVKYGSSRFAFVASFGGKMKYKFPIASLGPEIAS